VLRIAPSRSHDLALQEAGGDGGLFLVDRDRIPSGTPFVEVAATHGVFLGGRSGAVQRSDSFPPAQCPDAVAVWKKAVTICRMCRPRPHRQRDSLAATSTAQQWSEILEIMQTLATTSPTPIPTAVIAQRAKMEEADALRHLRLMARVGLVHRARQGWHWGWLLDRTP